MMPYKVGVIFTPDEKAGEVIRSNDLAARWLEGATFLDPTAGEGAFLKALIREARKLTSGPLPYHNLYANEWDGEYLENFRRWTAENHAPIPSQNLFQSDIILDSIPVKADFLIGNPPWINFSDLPDDYKQRIKPQFRHYKLVDGNRTLLMGRARVDLSALVVIRALTENLSPRGSAFFFLPLSLFYNDGCHEPFRRLISGTADFRLKSLKDFGDTVIFSGVSTRYCLASFSTKPASGYEHTIEMTGGTVSDHRLYPTAGAPFRMHLSEPPRYPLRPDDGPRQGVNTGGANDLLIFNEFTEAGDRISVNSPEGRYSLPRKYLFPLVSSAQYRGEQKPARLILMPYEKRQPVSREVISVDQELDAYLGIIQSRLENRRGTMLRSMMKRSGWWCLLGVGKYSFAPWKVVWQALGGRGLRPVILGEWNGQPWMPNQAQHAFLPCSTREEAEKLREFLESAAVREYLDSFAMEGTKGYAQPGRMKALFDQLR